MADDKLEVPPAKMVTIESSKLKELMESALFLECLESCGVDNWSGYDDAREMYREATDSL